MQATQNIVSWCSGKMNKNKPTMPIRGGWVGGWEGGWVWVQVKKKCQKFWTQPIPEAMMQFC